MTGVQTCALPIFNAALHACDYAYVMETGRITMSGTGEALLADQRVRDAYLGSTAR